MKKNQISKLSIGKKTISNLQQINGGIGPQTVADTCKSCNPLCAGTGCVCPGSNYDTCGIVCAIM